MVRIASPVDGPFASTLGVHTDNRVSSIGSRGINSFGPGACCQKRPRTLRMPVDSYNCASLGPRSLTPA